MSLVLTGIKLRKSFERLTAILILLAANGFAAELTIVAIGPDGGVEAGCEVESFRTIHVGSKVERDYRGQFRGLSGSGIPLGNYEARIACGDDGELTQTINLKNGSQLELVAFSGRLMRSEPTGPELVVKLANVPSGNEIWWLRLDALYGQESYIARFGVASGEARLVDPEPGVYLVSVHSTSGYGCVSEVHFVEFTRRWIFHAEACSFEFDRYAELIQRDASHRPVPSQWSEETQRYKLEFLRALEKAAERQ